MSNNLLYVRGEETKSETEDVWDDTALIQAYDRAVNLAKEEVAKRIAMDIQGPKSKQKSSTSKRPTQANQHTSKWTVGSPCRAVYSEDGEIYEAIVEKIHENGLCTVKFIGYNNSERVELKSLLESEGLQSQIEQQKDALAQKADQETADSDTSGYSTHQKSFNTRISEKMDCDDESHRPFKNNYRGPRHGYFNSTMPPPPPLPPQLMAKLPETDADALSSMLMSWYISGFHTGYYHGLQQAKYNQQKRRNCK